MKIGVLGGGQLASMLAMAAKKLGIDLICIDPVLDCCAQQVTSVIHADFHDLEEIQQAFQDISCVTYETENLPLDAVSSIAMSYPLLPGLMALKITQDRVLEKNFLNEFGIPTAKYHSIDEWSDILHAIKILDFPLLLKTQRNGYDGKGQFLIHSEEDAKKAWALSPTHSLIAVSWVSYQFEVSLIFARNTLGEMVFYPLTRNHHEQGILRMSEAPYRDSTLQAIAENHALAIAEKLNYVGIMAIEFFCKDGQLIVNEMAPRVHNSGHWTIEGAATSQFENHLRAITGLPLGPTNPQGFTTMLNCIGHEPEPIERLVEIPGLHLHTYGKAPRSNRKVGHITLCAADPETLAHRLKSCQGLIEVGIPV